jgi:hypothetical protein
MFRVPQQDWAAYKALTAESDAAWVRGLTTSERFALYADLFDMVHNARRGPGDWERLDRWAWEQKLAIRLKLVDAFAKLDQLRSERAAANNPG